MKKIICTFLAILYLGTSLSFAVHSHYCMDKLVETSFFINDEKECAACGMERENSVKSGCCKNELQELKVDKQHNLEVFALQLMQTLGFSLPPAIFNVFFFSQLATSAVDYPLVNSPPEITNVPAYVRNCVFLI